MLFFSRSNTVLQYVAPIKGIYRYLLTICASIALIVAWWLCVYKPLALINLSYMQENIVIKQQCDNHTHDCQSVDSLKDTIKDLHYNLDIYGVRTSHNPQETYIVDIMQAIQAQGLSLSSYSVEREKDKKDYTKSLMRFSLIGNHQQLVQLLEQLHAKKMIIGCNTITMQAIADEKYTMICEFVSVAWNEKKPSNLE
jgi:Tfp pilus assembly protein PilO